MAKRKAYLMRLDPALLDALERWAADEFRSLNGQLEFLLTSALRKADRLPKRRAAEQDEEAEPSEMAP